MRLVRPSRALWILLAWAAAAAPGSALSPSPAAAQPVSVPRVVVLRFEGWRSARARQAVLEGLAGFADMVDEEQIFLTGQDLGVDASTPEGMAEVVEHMGITLVIAGSVDGRGRRAQTSLLVVDPSGEELASQTAPGPRTASDRAEIGVAAVRAVQQAQAALEARHAAAEQPIEPEPDPEPDVEPEPEPEPEGPPPGWRQPMVRALVGVRLRTIGTYLDAASGSQSFTADVYPEIDLFGQFRPWAAASDELRGILFGVQGSFSVGIAYLTAAGEPRSMTSFRARADVGYGFGFGELFELAATLGFGVEGVRLDQPEDFPSTLFSYLRPGLAARLAAYQDLLVVEAGVGGRIGLDGGDLASAYGPGMFFGGLDVYGGLAGQIEPGFGWAARFGYVHHVLSFDGEGGPFGDASSGTDEAIDVRLLVGWSS